MIRHVLKLKLFAIIFFFFNAPTYADWSKIVQMNGKTYYVSYERITKKSDGVYYWQLIDFLTLQDKGYKSLMALSVVDCELLRQRGIQIVTYKRSMGKGHEVHNYNPDPKWRYASPGSHTEKILKVICSR